MAPEVMTSGKYDIGADIFSFGIVLSEVIACSEAEDVIDETRTNEFGLDVDKLSKFVIDDKDNSSIAKDIIHIAGHCCTLNPTQRLKSDQIVGQLQRIQIRYQSNRLRPLSAMESVLETLPRIAVEEEEVITSMEISPSSPSMVIENEEEKVATPTATEPSTATSSKMKQLFDMVDKDGDGYLCYNETKKFAKITDGYDLTRDDYNMICNMYGVQTSATGLSKEHLNHLYSELRIGDPGKDLDAIMKDNEQEMTQIKQN